MLGFSQTALSHLIDFVQATKIGIIFGCLHKSTNFQKSTFAVEGSELLVIAGGAVLQLKLRAH
jgi:hypothetical protein